MPRHINAKQAKSLVKSGKAAYDDGHEPEEESCCQDSFCNVMDGLKSLSEQMEQHEGSASIIAICSEIVSSVNTYHLTVIEEMAKIEVNPVVDTSKLDAINDRLLTVIQELSMRKPKEWNFEVERDMMGEITNVKATEDMH